MSGSSTREKKGMEVVVSGRGNADAKGEEDHEQGRVWEYRDPRFCSCHGYGLGWWAGEEGWGSGGVGARGSRVGGGVRRSRVGGARGSGGVARGSGGIRACRSGGIGRGPS